MLLDTGQGPVSLGLYTAVEVVDDTVIERSFADAGGNIYEGDGAAASLATGTRDQIQASFQKENNPAAADWSDIQELYDVLHSTLRTADVAAWHAKLEAVFDVDTFLEWLALNTTIQDWDAYGTMSHNYYLYHDPKTDRLVWISWDHNEAFGASGHGDTSVDKASIGQDWPLIRFLLDDPVYQAKYTGYLRSALADAFIPAKLTQQIDTWAALIQPYVSQEGKTQAFEAAVGQLKTLLTQRAAAVESYLAGKAVTRAQRRRLGRAICRRRLRLRCDRRRARFCVSARDRASSSVSIRPPPSGLVSCLQELSALACA